MAEFKLRVNIGGHEFEADGPIDNVQAQFDAFTRLVLKLTRIEGPASVQEEAPTGPRLENICRMLEKTPFIEAPADLPDMSLLILLAYKQFTRHELVSGLQMMRSLRQSGFHIHRADQVMNKHAENGLVAISGKRRLRRYRLTQAGMARAQDLVHTIAPLARQPAK
jgi:hypothetical protein